MFFNKSEDQVMLGGKKVEVKKLSVTKWKKVIGTLNQLPSIVISLFVQGNRSNIAQLIVAALDLCFDEVMDVIAIASDLDKTYIEEHAALDEIVEYLEILVKKNNLVETIKKLKTASGPLFNILLEKAKSKA